MNRRITAVKGIVRGEMLGYIALACHPPADAWRASLATYPRA
jgi:hypothetical protein